jgi:hypothetical protein
LNTKLKEENKNISFKWEEMIGVFGSKNKTKQNKTKQNNETQKNTF